MSGIRELDDLAKSLGNMTEVLPNRELGKIVKRGADMVLRATRSAAPMKTGQLRDGIVLHKEKSKHKGKAVYDVYMDPNKNDVFQKPIKNRVRSQRSYAYYPASQEHGFFSRRPDGGMTYTRPDGSVASINKVPGKHYMRTGAEVAGEAAKKEIVTGITDVIVKEFGG